MIKRILVAAISALSISVPASAISYGKAVVTPGQGTEKVYSLGANTLSAYYETYYSDGFKSTIIWGQDGKDVWMGLMFPNWFYDKEMYVHGTVNGNKITIGKQLVYKDFMDIEGDVANDVSILPLQKDSKGNFKEAGDSFTMTIDDKGDITIDKAANGDTIFVALAHLNASGSIDNLEKGIEGANLSNYVSCYTYTEIPDRYLQTVQIPASVTMSTYVLSYGKDIINASGRRNVKIGFDGNDVYLQNFSPSIDSAVVKGCLSANGDTISIPDMQYLGLYNSIRVAYNSAIKTKEDGRFTITDDQMTRFVRDADDVWHLADGLYIGDISYQRTIYSYYTDVKFSALKPFVADTPQDPYNLHIIDTNIMGFAMASLFFTYHYEGIAGNPLNEEKLYYRLYLDGKQADLAAQGFPEASQYPDGLIPVTAADNNFNQPYGENFVNLTNCTWKTAGIQLVYVFNGEQYTSQIVTIDRATGEVISGISSVNGDAEASVSRKEVVGGRIYIRHNGKLYTIDGRKCNR